MEWERRAWPYLFVHSGTCVWSIYGIIDLGSVWLYYCSGFCQLLMITTSWNVLLLSLSALVLHSSCSCRPRQVAWNLVGGPWGYLCGWLVLILFKEPTFPVGTGSVSLLLLCDMIQRLYLFLSSLWYSQRQRRSCVPDHWLCREAQQCQKRKAVCCHHIDVI